MEPRRRISRWVRVPIGIGIGVVALVLVLRLETVRTPLVNELLERINPWPGTTLVAARTGGTVLTELRVYDLTLTRSDGSEAIRADSLELTWSPLALFSRSIRLDIIDASGLDVRARRLDDRSLDLVAPFLEDTTTSAWTTHIGAFQLRRGRFAVLDSAGEAFTADEVTLVLGDLESGESFGVRVDTLGTRLLERGTDIPGNLAFAGRWGTGSLEVDTLALTTRRSRVYGSGLLGLTPTLVRADSARGLLRLSPFAAADFSGLFPWLREDAIVEGLARFGSDGGVWQAEGTLVVTGGSGSSRVAWNADWTPGPDDRFGSIRGHLDTGELRPGLLLEDLDPADRVAMTIDATLDGDSLQALTGTIDLAMGSLTFAGLDANGQVRQTWTNGHVSVSGRGDFSGQPWQVEAEAAPFEHRGPWSTEFHVTTPPMDRLSAGSSLDAGAGLVISGRGNGFDRTALGALRIAVTDGHVGGCDVGPGELSARFGRGELQADLDLPVCGGTVSGQGRIDSTGAWTLEHLALIGMDVAPALGDSSSSRFDAHLSGRGTGRRGHLDMRLDSLVWESWRLDEVSASATGSMENLSLTAEARVDSGWVRMQGIVRGTNADLTELRLDRLDAGALSGVPRLATTLSGTGQASASWGTTLRARATFDMAPSRVNAQPLTSGSVTLSYGDVPGASSVAGVGARTPTAAARPDLPTSAAASLRLDWLGGGIELTTDIDPLESGWRLDDLVAHFTGLDAGAWTGVSNLTTDLSGRLDASLTSVGGTSGGAFDLAISRGAHVNRVLIDSVHVAGVVSPDSMALTTDARFADRAGRLHGDLLVRSSTDRPSFDLTLDADSVDFARLAGIDTVSSHISLRADLSGSGIRPETSTWEVSTTGIRGRWREATIERAMLTGRMRDGAAIIDSMDAVGSFGQLAGSGFIPLYRHVTERSAAFSFTGRLADVGPLASLAGFDAIRSSGGRLDGTISGPFRRLSLNANVTANGLAWGDLHIADLRGIVSAEAGSSLETPAFAMRLNASVLSLPGTAAESAAVDLISDADSLSLDGRIQFAAGRSIRIMASADPDLRSIGLDRFDLDLDGARWRLSGPVSATRGEDGFGIDHLVLDAQDGQISMGGRLGGASTDFYLAARSVRMDAIADLVGFRGLSLEVDANLSASDRTGSVIVGGTLQTRIGSFGRPAADLSMRTAYRAGVIQIDGRLEHVRGAVATIRGAVTPPSADRPEEALPLDLQIETTEFPVEWTLPFFDRALIDDIGGTIAGSLTMTGDFNDPDLRGEAVFSNGRIGLPTLGKPGASLKMQNVSASLGFDGNTVTVESATMQSGPGRLNASGTVELERLTLGTVNLSLQSSEFLAIDDAVYRAFVSTDLRLTGSTRRPVLGGRVLVSRGDFRLADETSADAFEPVALGREDLLTLERRFGLRVSEADTSTFVFYEALTIEEMRLEFERDAWMRSASNPRMDVQFTGNLDVRKRPHSEPTVFGDITLVPENSRIEQFGRRFSIEHGTLSFTGSAFEPDVDLAGIYRVPSRGTGGDEVVIRLVANGRPDDLRVTFESDPAMELADVLSYIATGRPASGSLQFGSGTGNSYLNAAAGLAVGPISNLMEEIALAGLGLDVVEIEHEGLDGLTLTAGKYVSPRFYVSVSQPIALGGASESSQDASSRNLQVTMEYEIIRKLLLSLMNRGAVLKVNLRWEYAF